MARILLAKARYTPYHLEAIVPPLGIMYIASSLRAAGHDVRIYDCGEDWNDPSRFRAALLSERPDVVGISAITLEGTTMEGMANVARQALPNVPIIVGGPHPSAYPEHCAKHPTIDYVVIGEGEATAVELVDALTGGERDPASIAGIAYRDAAGEVVFTSGRPGIEDVDGIPFPAWDLVDLDLYARMRSMGNMGRRRYMLLFTSRGCPFKCIYCHEVQGKRFRARSPENVLAEMRMLRDRYGISDFEIIDDIFNFSRGRMTEILDRIIASDLQPHLHFPNALRTDLLDSTDIAKLHRAGTTSLSVAVETVTPRLQKLIKKHLKVARVQENIEVAARQGMWVRGFFMLGFPTETLEEARSTVAFALKSSLHEGLFFTVTPFAGTTLYKMYQELLRERGVEIQDFTHLEYYKGSINLSEMSDEELFSLQRSAYRRFFFDPRRMARSLVRHPRPHTLVELGIRAAYHSLSKARGQSGAAPVSRWPAPPPRRVAPTGTRAIGAAGPRRVALPMAVPAAGGSDPASGPV